MNISVIKSKALQKLSPGSECSVFSDGSIAWHVVVGTKPTDEDIQTEVDRIIADMPWEELRNNRSRLLAETDWTQGADVPSAIKTPWATYRQQLRDLPASSTPTLKADGTLDRSSVTWPTKPS